MLTIAVPPAGTAEGAVVALTSFVAEDRVHAALDAGAAGYLLKDPRPRSARSSRTVRSRFEALRIDGILDRRYRVYRASHVALYSSF